MIDVFQFEADFANNLQCIPMQVRLKLDTCGVKLKLQQWNILTEAEKKQLITNTCNNPTETQQYKELLEEIVLTKTGKQATLLPIEEHPDWLDGTKIPEIVVNKAAQEKVNLTLKMWSSLTPLQRFALLKLSAPGHENKNFVAAFKEFSPA